jgi:hypothetical protein
MSVSAVAVTRSDDPSPATSAPSSGSPFRLAEDFADDGLNRAATDEATLDALRSRFDAAAPFPHLVIDNLFDPRLLRSMLPDYERLGGDDWIKYDNRNELKRGTRPNIQLGAGSQSYFDLIHRARFTRFLTRITGIEALVTDPALRGGGLHEIPTDGKFRVHVDFTRHTDTLLDNRLVFITYLNEGWQEDWGGALELWNRSACVEKVVPVFGRSILFAQSAESFHGHPDPVRAPDGRPRRSAAAYFYTNGRPDPTPAERLTTRYLQPDQVPLRERVARGARYVLPPVVWDGLKLVRRGRASRS